MKPRSPLPRASKKRLAENGGRPPFASIRASSKKAIRKKKRKPSEFARIYHSKARVEFVKSLPCAACGVVGYSENAHVAPPGEKGTGYKAGYKWIVPFCGRRPGLSVGEAPVTMGCHTLHDEYRGIFAFLFPDFNAETAAKRTQELWLESQA